MARIPTPVPKTWAKWASSTRRQSIYDLLWKALVIVVGGTLIIAALASSFILVSTLAGIILFWALSDSAGQTASDVWNRNFWVWRV